MKKNIAVKAILDIAMVLVFALLFNKMVLGMTFHEAGGLALGIAVLAHLILNRNWVVGITRKFFGKSLPFRTRLGYIINFLLLISFIVIIISGIAISKVLFTSLRVDSSVNFKMLHIGASYFALILMGIHLGLHVSFIKHVASKMLPIKSGLATKCMSIVIIFALFVGGGYNFFNTGVISHLGFGMAQSAGSLEGGPKGGSERSGMHQGGGSFASPTEGQLPTGDGQGGPTDGQMVTNDSSNGTGERLEGHDQSGVTISLSNVLLVIVKYISIMGFVAVIVGSIDTMLKRRRKIVILQ